MEKRPAAMDEWVVLSDGESDTSALVLDGSDDTASDDNDCSDTDAYDVYNGKQSGYTARSRPLVSHFGGVDGPPPPPVFYDGPLRAVVATAAPPAPPKFVKEVRYSYGEALSIGGGDEIKERLAASEIEATTERSKLTICEIGNAGVVICDGDVVEHTADVDDGGATTDDISVVEVTDVVDHTAPAHVDDGSASTDDGISVVEVIDVVDHTAHVDEGGPAADGISVVDVTDVVDHTAKSRVDDGGAAADVPPVTVSAAAPPPTSNEVDDEHESSRSPPTPIVAAPRATDPSPPPRFSRAARLSRKNLYNLLDKPAADDEHDSKSGDAPPTPAAVLIASATATTSPPPPDARTSGEVDKSVVVDDEPVQVLTAAAAMNATASDSGGEDPAHGGGSRCMVIREVGEEEETSHQVLNLRQELAMLQREEAEAVRQQLAMLQREEAEAAAVRQELAMLQREEAEAVRQELAMLQREEAVANQRLGRRDGYGRLWPQSPAAINAAYDACMRAQALLATINAAAPEAPTTQAPPADRRHASGQFPAAINAALEARTEEPLATTKAAPEAATINAAPEARTKVPMERRRGSEPSEADMADFAIAYLFSSSSMILYSFLLASYFY